MHHHVAFFIDCILSPASHPRIPSLCCGAKFLRIQEAQRIGSNNVFAIMLPAFSGFDDIILAIDLDSTLPFIVAIDQ